MKLFNKEKDQVLSADQVIKVSALQYLREALYNEEYEKCGELVDAAKKSGASQGEISKVIIAYIRGKEAGGFNEANPNNNRLRF